MKIVQLYKTVKKEVGKDPIQLVFFLLIIFSVGMFFPFTYECYLHYVDINERVPEGVILPYLSDLKQSILWSMIFAVIQYVLQSVFYQLFLPYCKEQKDLVKRDMRVTKAAHYLYCSSYFIVVVAWGYHILMDKPYFPRFLGGSGDQQLAWKNWPFLETDPQIGQYLLITQGYHIASLINHFRGPRRNDFVEMSLHHIVAIYLYTGSYMVNGWTVSANIAFLHDIADIWTGFVKAASETNNSNLAAVLFISLLPVWFYTRLLVLPYMIYSIWTTQRIYESYYTIKPFFCYLLGCMAALHLYWFQLFIQILMHYMKKGEAEDLQEKSVIEEGKTKKKT